MCVCVCALGGFVCLICVPLGIFNITFEVVIVIIENNNIGSTPAAGEAGDVAAAAGAAAAETEYGIRG